MTKSEPALTFSCQCIAFVVVKDPASDRFVCTDEKKGWYTPAGRVDYGESFSTAAKRETEEEAGVKVNLDGILWIRYSITERGWADIRVFFRGSPVSDNFTVKDFHDKESHGAELLTLDEIEGIQNKDPKVLEKLSKIPRIMKLKEEGTKAKVESLRSWALVTFFQRVLNGTRVFNNSFYNSKDGKHIDPKIRTVKSKIDSLVLLKHNDSYRLMRCLSTKALADPVKSVKAMLDNLLSKKALFGKKKNFGAAELKGFLGLHHFPPQDKNQEARFVFCFLAEISNLKPTAKLEFFQLKEIKDQFTKDDEIFCLTNYENDEVAPLELLTNTTETIPFIEAKDN